MMDRLDQSNAKDAKHIHAMILSDDVSDGDNIEERMESHEEYVELREVDSGSAKDAASDDDCCN
jgi:hypothetical protein